MAPQPHAGHNPPVPYNVDDNAKIPDEEGKPPRPATEPAGAEHSTKTSKTLTDPATGEPNR